MKKWLTILLLLLAPLGTTGALIYKIATGEISDPTFYILIVILPSSILAAVRELRAIAPPDRIRITIRSGARGKHWLQGSNWDSGRSRELTSLYIPVRLENSDSEKSVTIYDVTVVDRLRGIAVQPPKPNNIMIGVEERWVFQACELANESILNVDQTEIPSAQIVDTTIMIQEEGHHDRYDLAIAFRDNYGRRYSLTHKVEVSKVAKWDNGTTEWAT
jgi:hypothetical protein